VSKPPSGFPGSNREKSPRLLAALESTHCPSIYGRQARLRPKQELPQSLLSQYRIPRWDWTAFDAPAGDVIRLDGNADHLSAAASVRVAMEQLEHTGKMPADKFAKAPGFYLIRAWDHIHPANVMSPHRDPSLDLHSWSDRRFCSPLGRDLDAFVWVAEPTLSRLHELQRDDEWWGELTIHDSWTCEDKVSLQTWTKWVDAQRMALKADPDRAEELAAFKLAYSQAVQMIAGAVDKATGKDKCLIRRPDWYAAIRAQQRANQHRKVWNAIKRGVPIVSVGGNDEIRTTPTGIMLLETMDKPPIRLHPTALGAYKVKEGDE
jgi:hypothetical protein